MVVVVVVELLTSDVVVEVMRVMWEDLVTGSESGGARLNPAPNRCAGGPQLKLRPSRLLWFNCGPIEVELAEGLSVV